MIRADNVVLLWDLETLAAKKKFSMDGSVLCSTFNPVTNKLFVGSTKDTGIYTPDAEKNALDRKQIKTRVTSADWSADGKLLLFGTANGLVAIKDAQFEKKVNIQKLSGVTCLRWCPILSEAGDLLFVVACEDQTISFHREEGSLIGFEKKVKCEIHSIDWFMTGEYFIAGGSSSTVYVFSRDGYLLQEIECGMNWVWAVKFENNAQAFGCAGSNGQVKLMAFDRKMPVAVFEDKVALRVGMTELVIRDVNSDQKAKLKCKELIKNVAIYYDILAVHTSTKVLLYREILVGANEGVGNGSESFSFKQVAKIERKIEGSFFGLLSENFVVGKDNRISCFDFGRNLTREWIFESNVTFMKSLGGPPREESLLVGLKNGSAFKLFVSSPFPIGLIDHGVEIVSLDLNLTKLLLGLVDSRNNFYLYDTTKKESISSELKISQCAFSEDIENMYVVMGESFLFVKSTDAEGVSVAATGQLLGFKKGKIRLANGESVSSIEVPAGAFLAQAMAKKDFRSAYRIACLGASDQEIRNIGLESIKSKDFATARKCFTKTRDVQYIDVVSRCEDEMRSGRFDEIGLQVELLCYEKKIPKAIELLKKEGKLEKAIELCITMRKWTEAIELIKSAQNSGQLKNDKFNVYKLLKMQAESENLKGNWKAAVDLLMSSNNETRALEILIKQDQEEQVLQTMRRLNKANNSDSLRDAVKYFVSKKNHSAGKEALLKLGDQEELMRFHIELDKWEEAQMLAKSDESLKQIMLIPYADWLSKKNRFDEASEYYKQAGRVDLAMQILRKLSEVSVVQERYREAGQFHWILAKENLKSVNSYRGQTAEDKEKLAVFDSCLQKSLIFHAYYQVLTYVNSPVKVESFPGETKWVFNASRFILANLKASRDSRVID